MYSDTLMSVNLCQQNVRYNRDVMSRDLLPAFNATQATVDYYHAGGVLRWKQHRRVR